MWKHPSPQSICPLLQPPLWSDYQHKWQACCPHGDGLAQTGETSQNAILDYFCILDHRHWAGASLFHRSTEVLKAQVWKVWVKVRKRCLSTGYGEAVSSGYRRVFSKDLLFQVGLAQWKVIHSNTLEANEKAPQDVVQRASEWRNTHQFKTCRPGAL